MRVFFSRDEVFTAIKTDYRSKLPGQSAEDLKQKPTCSERLINVDIRGYGIDNKKTASVPGTAHPRPVVIRVSGNAYIGHIGIIQNKGLV